MILCVTDGGYVEIPNALSFRRIDRIAVKVPESTIQEVDMDNLSDTAVDKTTYQSIAIDQIKPSPFQARKTFDEASLNELAQSMKAEGLIQSIIVRASADGSYELIVGERRLRAAKLLGWAAIDAIIRPGVSDQDAALQGVIENLQRVDLNPLERAQGYKRLADIGLSQEQIAEKVGLSDHNTVSRYMLLLDLPPEIQELLPRGRISEGHTRFIRQIPDKTQQIKVAQQADKEGWSVNETEKHVNALLGKSPKAGSGKGSSHAPSTGSPAPHPTLPDPLAEVWAEAKVDVQHHDAMVYWQATYGAHKIPNTQGVTRNGWTFTVGPMIQEEQTKELARWLYQMSQAVARKAGVDPSKTNTDEKKEMDAKMAEMAATADQCVMPSSSSEFSQMQEDQKSVRLPKSPEEQAEVEALATHGPGAVYAWIFGPNSLMAKKIASATWADMNITDPLAGCRQLVEGIRKFQDSSSKKPEPVVAVASSDPLTP